MNALKRWLICREVTKFVDNAIKESQMSILMKSWLIGAANAAISGAAAGLASVAVGSGMKQSVIILLIATAVSLVKWMAQHPIPAPVEATPAPKPPITGSPQV